MSGRRHGGMLGSWPATYCTTATSQTSAASCSLRSRDTRARFVTGRPWPRAALAGTRSGGRWRPAAKTTRSLCCRSTWPNAPPSPVSARLRSHEQRRTAPREEQSEDNGQGGAAVNATIGLGRDLSILVEVFPGTSAIGIGTSAAEDRPRHETSLKEVVPVNESYVSPAARSADDTAHREGKPGGPTAVPQRPQGSARPPGWTGGRITALAAGVLLALVSVGLLGSGGTALWANAAQRDAAGYVTTGVHEFATAGSAVATERIDRGAAGCTPRPCSARSASGSHRCAEALCCSQGSAPPPTSTAISPG